MKKFLLAAIVATTFSGCTNLVSGGKTIAVAPDDPGLIANARATLLVPSIVPRKDELHPVLIVKFAFDGTLNDQARVPQDERQTIVSYIRSRVPDTHYYRGVGMQSRFVNMVDAALGRSMFSTAEEARTEFFSDTKNFLAEHPDGEVRVFVTGFSRGAATARHFMYRVEREWERRYEKQSPGAQPSLKFYALLYDTVSTGQHGNPDLHLELTRHLNYLVHFVARDEPRELYEVDIDSPVGSDTLWGLARVNTIYLPGAHSDIGASYRNGVGDNYRQLTDYVLSMFGLISNNCFDNPIDSLSQGKHDSRGILDKIANVPAPNSGPRHERPHRWIRPAVLTSKEAAEIQASNRALVEANMFRSAEFISTGAERFGFTAAYDGGQLKLISVPDNLVPDAARLSMTADGGAVFEFAFARVPQAIQKIRVSPRVIAKIKPAGSTVGVTYLTIKGGQRFNTFVDDELVEQVDWQSRKQVKIADAPHCPAN